MSKISDKVEALARPVVEEEGCKLWSVEYIKEAGTWYLRIFIEAISRRLDPILDEADPIPESYVFEVGSAGAERELKRTSDFEQFIGSDVEVKLYQPYEGRKTLVGTLEEYNDGNITVSGVELKKEQIAQVRLHVTI